MTESDYSVLKKALRKFQCPFSSDYDKNESAKSVFELLQERDTDPDVAECQDAVGKSGVLAELFEIYKESSGATRIEYVTLCLTWALFRNAHNSDILGSREDFGPTIKSILESTSVPGRTKSHAMDLWDNVVNNLTTFQQHILDIVPAFVNLLENTTSKAIKGRCINSARISSYRKATREALRETNVVDLLLDVIRKGDRDLAPHAACQAVANLVGHIPNHPALAASAKCVGDLVDCFERALDDKDYPEYTNTFPNDFFVCMGLANLANSDSMKRLLIQHNILPLLEKAVLKNSKGDSVDDEKEPGRLKVEAYKCILNISSVKQFARLISKERTLMSEIKFNTKHGDARTQKLAREIIKNITASDTTMEEMKIDERTLCVTPVKAKKAKKTMLCEIKVTGRCLPKLVDELQQDGQFTIMEHPLVNSGMEPKMTKASSFYRWIAKRTNPKSVPPSPPVKVSENPLPVKTIAVVAYQNKRKRSMQDVMSELDGISASGRYQYESVDMLHFSPSKKNRILRDSGLDKFKAPRRKIVISEPQSVNRRMKSFSRLLRSH